MLTLQADIRDTKIDTTDLRKAGHIPAVFYGKREASTPITLKQTEFMKVWKEAGESSVVTLNTPQGPKDSLIHDVEINSVTGIPTHVDFYVFEAGHKVEVSLPIEFVGVSAAVKDLGGTLVKVLHELAVEAMPKDLPHNIAVDISALANFGDQIAAKDIPLPKGVELKANPEEMIVTVSAPREEKEEEAVVAPDLSSIEVEKKGKEESAEGEVAEAKAE